MGASVLVTALWSGSLALLYPEEIFFPRGGFAGLRFLMLGAGQVVARC